MNSKKKNKIPKLLLGSPDMGAPMQPYQSQDMVMSNAGAWTSVHNIFMQAPVAIMVLSGNNYIVESANDFYLKIIEKDKDFIGKPIFDSLPELESQGIRQLLDTVMESGIPYNGYEMEVHLNRDDKKSQGFYNFVYQPIREQDNTISGIIVVASEVTEQVLARKRIEESLQQYQYHTMTHSSPSAIGILQGADLIITTANEEKFRLLVQQAPVAICVLRGENYVIEVINEPMYEMWDRTLEQVLNKPVFDVLTELKDQGFKELLDNVYHNGERFVAEELPLSLKRDGKLDNIFVKFVYEPLREADGTISGVMALAHDITQQVVARKKIKESESHFRLIAELMPEKIINAKPDGTIFYYNKSWQDYTGASFDELIRDGWEKWVHPEAAAEAIQHWQHSIETGDNFDMEFQMLCHTGDYRWHTSRARSVKDENGNTKLWIGFNSDIHDQKIQKQELQQAVAIRTSALLRANEELQQKNQEIALSKYNKRFLTEFSEKFNSYKLHNEIFNSLVEYVADIYSTQLCLYRQAIPK